VHCRILPGLQRLNFLLGLFEWHILRPRVLCLLRVWRGQVPFDPERCELPGMRYGQDFGYGLERMHVLRSRHICEQHWLGEVL